MEVSKTHKDILIDFNESLSIETNFIDHFESGYIALHPFYKRVFQDDFDYQSRLRDTFHLIEPVTWNKVITELKFKSLNQLAKALLKHNVPYAKELVDFVAYKRLLFPVIEEDTIPELLLYKYIKFLLGQGANEVISGYSKHTLSEEHRNNTNIQIDHKNIFDVIGQLQYRFVVKGNTINIILLLPDHDCPYTLVLGDKKLVSSLITDFSVEGFWIDKNTKFDWWEE